jgi:hypothetical protein
VNHNQVSSYLAYRAVSPHVYPIDNWSMTCECNAQRSQEVRTHSHGMSPECRRCYKSLFASFRKRRGCSIQGSCPTFAYELSCEPSMRVCHRCATGYGQIQSTVPFTTGCEPESAANPAFDSDAPPLPPIAQPLRDPPLRFVKATGRRAEPHCSISSAQLITTRSLI